MATLDLKPLLSSNKITAITYDDVTGAVSATLAAGITTEENVLQEIVLGVEESAQGQRTNLDSPISEKAFPDNPQFNFVNRANADGTVTELQIERILQFVLWQKAPDLSTSDAVNDND